MENDGSMITTTSTKWGLFAFGLNLSTRSTCLVNLDSVSGDCPCRSSGFFLFFLRLPRTWITGSFTLPRYFQPPSRKLPARPICSLQYFIWIRKRPLCVLRPETLTLLCSKVVLSIKVMGDGRPGTAGDCWGRREWCRMIPQWFVRRSMISTLANTGGK